MPQKYPTQLAKISLGEVPISQLDRGVGVNFKPVVFSITFTFRLNS